MTRDGMLTGHVSHQTQDAESDTRFMLVARVICNNTILDIKVQVKHTSLLTFRYTTLYPTGKAGHDLQDVQGS